MKKDIAKMFIPITMANGKTTVISANKIEQLRKYLPSIEALSIHMEIQRLNVMKDESYKPNPLCIEIPKGDFELIINKISNKASNIHRNLIPLVLQFPAIPICIIKAKEEK